ncbi:unnamed protein product [Rotaria sp. Silwood1]|nr:unnamed protein product [Rotaria sp. Silwood1]CAF3566415.1 unnamed protein product [Rotaria sp. Silwood1]CAF4904849.1 unnamed protein product [Rotaria sp. Silwood1]
MECCPVYEFPYCGYQPCSIQLCNDDINTLLSNINPPIDAQCCYQSPTITLNCVPQINSSACNRDTLVYQAPDTMPIETILQEFGVNVNTVQPCSSLNTCYRKDVCEPMEVTILSPLRRRRRRLICHEVSDSEDDHYYRRRPRYRRHSYDPDSRPDRSEKSPTAAHDALSNVWERARTASEHLPRSSTDSNIARQWEAMRRSTPPPPSNVDMNRVWQSMQRTPPPDPTISRAWEAMQRTPPPNPAISRAWEAMQRTPPSDPTISRAWEAMQRTPPANPATLHAWEAMRNAPSPPNPATLHAWEAMQKASPPPNPAAMNAWQAMVRASPPPNPAAMNAWQAMLRASPPTSPTGQTAVYNAWQNANLASQQQANRPPQVFNVMQQTPGNVIQPPLSQPNPAVLNAWSRANLASPPTANNPWNRMPTYPSPYSPGGLPPRMPGPVRAPAPASFASLLSQAQRQHLPYVGAA